MRRSRRQKKGLKRLWEAYESLKKIELPPYPLTAEQDDRLNTKNMDAILDSFYESMNDDFNTAKVIASMFELVPIINSIKYNQESAREGINPSTLEKMKSYFKVFLEDILGLRDEDAAERARLNGVLDLLMDIRKEAKTKRDYATSDKIRNQLMRLGILMKDEKNGEMSFSFE